ncbi:MAG: hypothetical protein RL885_12260 [Planctomycetota bacterium]
MFWWIGLPACLGTLIWVWILLEASRRRHHHQSFLCDVVPEAPSFGWPTLTVVLAARDEAEHVTRSVRSLLQQDYEGLRVIAVDDR